MTNIGRRTFLASAISSLLLGTAIRANPVGIKKSMEEPSFSRLEKRKGRWWLIQPDNSLFFSLGLNHVDPASLRYPENIHIWEDKYGNSMERWLKESVQPRLLDWGFNCLGWSREVITRGLTHHRHSRHFTYEEYQWLDMPYCHQLPFAEFHQWEAETRHPDFFSPVFAEWCDFVAREHCVPLANDSQLIGYFYIDCPTWVHTRPENEWKGPLFDPERLKTTTGRKELKKMATQWYRVTHEAIRRYDPHHLILGDRYEANEPLPMEVVEAARPYVDVLSFQDFRDPVNHLKEWHQQTGMPVLWADGAKKLSTDNPDIHRNDGRWYAEVLSGLRQNPGCVGAHLCGAYLRNKIRKRGLIDRNNVPDEEMISFIREANQEVQAWVASHR
ncbi:hypothetical protein [Tunicatimonas pelagia]|uniref:hypothetical protein n=1 Tax=Tunicatimonas pelagia TaxID=931531 RepID=UPI002665C8DC|nr:hypothetical protein [Tunicatimonas pelagia]WKN44988.1 hypothetical protein P0M28_08430 [Tunicatimonas pelagia]